MGEPTKAVCIIEGLKILMQYDEKTYVSAEHDQIWAGSEKTYIDKLSEDHKGAMIDVLRWFWDETVESWSCYV
jgi:hypothetical protein